MRQCLVIALGWAAFFLGQPGQRASAHPSAGEKPGPIAKELLGTWRLISIETVRPGGEVLYPFYGKHPNGLLIYERSGWMSVQIVSDPSPRVPLASSREGFLAAPVTEKVAAVEGYYAYYGTWEADPSRGTVTHHIVQSLYPGERGEDGVRHFQLDGERLTLTAHTHEMGEEHVRRLVWERLRAEP